MLPGQRAEAQSHAGFRVQGLALPEPQKWVEL